MLANRDVLSGRDRKRLQVACENGYLEASLKNKAQVLRAYGMWCWRLRIPMVWLERLTPRSRYCGVHLEMFPTPNLLTARGRAAMTSIEVAGSRIDQHLITAHDVCWPRVPLRDVKAVAKAAFRAATAAGNCELNRTKLVSIDRRKSGNLITMMPAKAGSA